MTNYSACWKSRQAIETQEKTSLGGARARRAFTLIELMVAIGIAAVIMTVAIPALYRMLHPDSMSKAVNDVIEACQHARAHAILNGAPVSLRFLPLNRQIMVVAGSAPKPAFEGPTYAFEEDRFVERAASGATIFSAKISDHIIIEFLGVNLIPDLQEMDMVDCTFYPNGTSDEMAIVLRSDQGEVRKITTEVVTGLADYDVIR